MKSIKVFLTTRFWLYKKSVKSLFLLKKLSLKNFIETIILLVLHYSSCQAYSFVASTLNASSDPLITAWIKSTVYSPYVPASNADVFEIEYSSKYVYIACNSLPSYTIGPWNNPNKASAQHFNFKFPRVPIANTGTKTTVGLGTIAVLINGVTIYNPGDAHSYNSLGIWNQNAYYYEVDSFDSCLGHPQPGGVYHNHVIPICLFNSTDSSKHSPLIGFAFDGYPIYGSFGYSSPTNTSSGIRRIISGYRTRSITTRTTLASGSSLLSVQYGPDVSATYPVGAYIEDYEYSSSYGDLDAYNGRFCITPEYPSGTYAYFVTTNSSGVPAYPFLIGPSYYGTVITENVYNNVEPDETVTTYFKSTLSSSTQTKGSAVVLFFSLFYLIF